MYNKDKIEPKRYCTSKSLYMYLILKGPPYKDWVTRLKFF
jgi:hypothetical protein